ncbi:MAG: S9 family peptidase [Bacteroidales bacterium]|nr:S9 family peptidase [Bacteroidales bacterium]
MKKLTELCLLAAFLFQGFTLTAQEKVLTLEDASWMNPAIFPARVAQLQWIGDSDDYAYAKENAIYKVTAKKGTETLLLDLDQMNGDLRRNRLDSLKHLPSLQFSSMEKCTFTREGKYYEYSLSTNKISEVNRIPDTAKNIDYHKKSGRIAYTLKNNLFISIDGKQSRITQDENPGIVNGQTVSRVEFGITTGTFWSPTGKKLAFYRKDETEVTDYPLVNINKRIAEVESTKYPMAGMTSEQVSLGVYDLESGKTIFLQTDGPKDQYLTAVSWGPEGKFIYTALLNRDQNHLKLNKYDAGTGDFVKTLFEEKNPKYVEPEHPLYFNPENPNEFIWFSERNGYDHLYLYNTDGELLKQLTDGEWVVTEFLGFYDKDKIFFKATKESPLQKNIYAISLKDGKITRTSPEHGTHTARISKSGKFIIDIFSNTETSRQYSLLNSKGKTLRIIKADKHALKDYKLGEMLLFDLKAPDGTTLYSRLIYPVDFDKNKKYPVIVYVYGGPHAQLVTDSWLGGAGLFLNYLASQGYFIFTLDNRGSANRGRDFEQAIFRNCGSIEVADQMVGVDYLKTLPYIDTARIGVDGWSYGGFMTTSLMVKQAETFKVGVAGGPVIDWQYYEVMYGERYMDTPESNPEGYKKASLLNYVDQLNGKLLLIHGTMDPTVVWQHSLLFLQKAIQSGKQMDYMVYPGHGHGVRGRDRLHLNTKIAEYFKVNL